MRKFIESRKRQARRLDSSIIATLRGTTDVGFRIGPPWSPFERVLLAQAWRVGFEDRYGYPQPFGVIIGMGVRSVVITQSQTS